MINSRETSPEPRPSPPDEPPSSPPAASASAHYPPTLEFPSPTTEDLEAGFRAASEGTIQTFTQAAPHARVFPQGSTVSVMSRADHNDDDPLGQTMRMNDGTPMVMVARRLHGDDVDPRQTALHELVLHAARPPNSTEDEDHMEALTEPGMTEYFNASLSLAMTHPDVGDRQWFKDMGPLINQSLLTEAGKDELDEIVVNRQVDAFERGFATQPAVATTEDDRVASAASHGQVPGPR